MSNLGSLTILTLFSISFEAHKCADIFSKFGNSELLITDVGLTFDDAEKKCKEDGATLPEIYSEDEWDQVTAK